MDLPLGALRVRMKGGDGGHRGVGSIQRAFGSDAFRRVKIGVGRPEQRGRAADHVLTTFAPTEMPVIERACTEAAQRILGLLEIPAPVAHPPGQESARDNTATAVRPTKKRPDPELPDARRQQTQSGAAAALEGPNGRRERRVKIAQQLAEKLALTAAFVGLGVVLFAAAMTAPLDYDEELYVTGAYFARSLSVYRDFVSVQPPLYTWILSAVFDVVGNWYLLTARLVTWVFGFGVCALLYSLLASCGTGRVVAFALVLGFVTSPFTQGPLVETRNDIMPLFFFLAALRLCLGPDGGFSRSVPRVMLGGFFAALAGSMKYTYLFAAPILAAALLYDEHVRREANRAFTAPRTGSFLAGAVAGCTPAGLSADDPSGPLHFRDAAVSPDRGIRLVRRAGLWRVADPRVQDQVIAAPDDPSR